MDVDYAMFASPICDDDDGENEKTDDDGVKVWYIRKSYIDRFMDEIEKQNISIDTIIKHVEQSYNMLKDIKLMKMGK